MRQVLSQGEYNALTPGQLAAPDGRTYNRRTTRMKRKEAAAMVEAGRPVVIYREGEELTWLDGDDATAAWALLLGSMTTEAPDPGRGESVTGGLWDSPDGSELLVLLWHH